MIKWHCVEHNNLIVFHQVIDLTDIERLSLHTLTLLLINLPELQVKFPPNAQRNHQQPHHCLVLSITSKAILDQLDLTQCTWISWTRSWITTTCMRLSGWCTRPGWKTGQIGILIMFGYWVRGRLTNMTFLCVKCKIQKNEVLERPNMCYIFEKLVTHSPGPHWTGPPIQGTPDLWVFLWDLFWPKQICFTLKVSKVKLVHFFFL